MSGFMKKTKIVCTMGPAVAETEMVKRLIAAGMDVIRLNFSHGDHEGHRRAMETVRLASQETGEPVGILVDIQGPKIRVCCLPGPVMLEEGSTVHLVGGDNILAADNRIPVDYPTIAEDVPVGNTVFLADGLIQLIVEGVADGSLVCRVVRGGELTSRKGVTLPGVSVRLPAVTDKDVEDIDFAIAEGADFLALSFVRRPEHIEEVRERLKAKGCRARIIAKIENQEGFNNREAILHAADGIMVARGDLGIEVPPEEVPLMQQQLIRAANLVGKPVITATEMLESMIRNPRPTRAEVTDVAHAILNGTDALMLSEETAIGKNPVAAVEIMAKVAERTESSLDYEEILSKKRIGSFRTISEAISHATCQTAMDLNAAAIITATQSGSTARKVSKFRPKAPIFASTPSPSVLRQLTLSWGVLPVLVPHTYTTDEMLDVSIEAIVRKGLVKEGDLVIITAGVRTGLPGSTNLLQVNRIGM